LLYKINKKYYDTSMLTFVLNIILKLLINALDAGAPRIVNVAIATIAKHFDKYLNPPKDEVKQPIKLAEIAYRTPPQKTRIINAGPVVEPVSSIAGPPNETKPETEHDKHVKELEAKVHAIATETPTPPQHYEVMATPEELQEYEAKKAKEKEERAKRDVKPN
jgi:hypothetical protein